MGSKRVAVTAQAGGRGRDGRRVAHVGDAPVPVGDEVGHGVEGRAMVVDLDQVRGEAGRRPVDEHDGHPGAEPGMITGGRAEQQSRDPPRHQATDDIALPARIAPRARDEHRPAVPRHLQLNRVDDVGEERISDGLHDEPDRRVRPGPQRPGHRIGLEPQLEHRLPDSLPGGRRDPWIVVQDPRSGAQAHPGCLRDIEQPACGRSSGRLRRAVGRGLCYRWHKSIVPDCAIDGKAARFLTLGG